MVNAGVLCCLKLHTSSVVLMSDFVTQRGSSRHITDPNFLPREAVG